ncbi:class I SAM-dependent methyltransferase [Mesorhizobium sp. Cs1299R1N1]
MNRLYTDLLIKIIANTIYGSGSQVIDPAKMGESTPFNREDRLQGRDWPTVAHSMAGIKRLSNVRDLVQRVIDENVPGDFIETGVWRGGCCILMKGVLAANEVTDRKVYVADSFDGLPQPDAENYPADRGDTLHEYRQLAIDQAQVESNFAAYDLLDDQVVFVKGLFGDTLPGLEAGPFALIRLDGDMYESTMDSLEALYPRLSPGGFAIIDDFALPPCRQAVEDYRERHRIGATIHDIDWTGCWWQKPIAGNQTTETR